MYAASAGEAWALSPYAALGAAQQALAAGRPDEAISRGRRWGARWRGPGAGSLAQAEGYEQKNALGEAVVIWRKYLEGLPASRPARWAEASVKLARALSAPGPQAPTAAMLEEAVALARRVAVEQPASPQAKPAQAVEQAALALLPAATGGRRWRGAQRTS